MPSNCIIKEYKLQTNQLKTGKKEKFKFTFGEKPLSRLVVFDVAVAKASSYNMGSLKNASFALDMVLSQPKKSKEKSLINNI